MENENFDEELKNRIKHIFEDYDDGRANEGWNLLREKYPQKKRRDYFFWWMVSAAALFLMALIIGFYQFETYQVKSAKKINQPKSDTETQAKTDSSFEKSIAKINSFDVKHTKKVVLKTASNFAFKQKSIQQKVLIIKSDQTKTTQTNKYRNTVFTNTKLVSADSINHPTQVTDFTQVDSLQVKKIQPIIQTQNPSIKPASKKEPIKTASIKKPLPKTSKFSWSIYAGPHVSLATGSNNQLGFGAGISIDLQISKKLKLSSGLGLIRNKLYYQNNFSNNSLLAANPLANSSQVVISNTTLNSLNANFLQLDVPINLIYNILPGKNSISVLTGLSSGAFAKESYQYNYAKTANDLQSSKSFQSFYLVKTLNVAAQFGLPFKKYSLQVEPFIKVPLGYMSSQQLKFGAAGINLKFNFQPLKK